MTRPATSFTEKTRLGNQTIALCVFAVMAPQNALRLCVAIQIARSRFTSRASVVQCVRLSTQTPHIRRKQVILQYSCSMIAISAFLHILIQDIEIS